MFKSPGFRFGPTEWYLEQLSSSIALGQPVPSEWICWMTLDGKKGVYLCTEMAVWLRDSLWNPVHLGSNPLCGTSVSSMVPNEQNRGSKFGKWTLHGSLLYIFLFIYVFHSACPQPSPPLELWCDNQCWFVYVPHSLTVWQKRAKEQIPGLRISSGSNFPLNTFGVVPQYGHSSMTDTSEGKTHRVDVKLTTKPNYTVLLSDTISLPFPHAHPPQMQHLLKAIFLTTVMIVSSGLGTRPEIF